MNEFLALLAGDVLRTSDRNLGSETVAAVVITGLAVVFVGLIILIALVWLYGKIFDAINKKAAAKAEAEKLSPDPVPTPAKVNVPAPSVEDGIEEEIVAVITAAIAAYSAQSGKKLAVKSIKKSSGSAPSGRNAWSAAGLAEATRPF